MAPIKFSPLFIDGITYLIGLQDEEMVSNLINLSSFYLFKDFLKILKAIKNQLDKICI